MMHVKQNIIKKLSKHPFFIVPYVSSIGIHVFILVGLSRLSSQPTPPKLRIFQETLVPPPMPAQASISSPPSIKTTTEMKNRPPAASLSPSATPPPKSTVSTTPKPEKMATSGRVQPSEKKQKVQALLQLTKQMERHAEVQNKQLQQKQQYTQIEAPSLSFPSAEDQNLEFQQLIQRYVTLPVHQDVRIKISFSQGTLDCVILSDIEDIYKQQILSQIYNIPFKQFFNKYNTSKNIVFHIKLRSKES